MDYKNLRERLTEKYIEILEDGEGLKYTEDLVADLVDEAFEAFQDEEGTEDAIDLLVRQEEGVEEGGEG